MSAENEVRGASERFYSALNRMANGEHGTMSAIWSKTESATALHPIGGRDIGWTAIAVSFDKVAEIASGGEIRLKDQVIRVTGDMAYEIGVEAGTLTLGGLKATVEHRVTNIYCRQGEDWKVLHHHADTSPAMMDVLSRLQDMAQV